MVGRQRVSLVILFAIASMVGCASSKSTKGEKVFETYQRTQTGLTEASKQVDKVMADMGQFNYTGNLNTMFKNYKASVAKLEEQGSDAKWRSESMNVNAEEYIKNWQKDMEKITDPAIKASLEERKAAVRADFEKIRTAAQEARKAYEPFMQDNKNILDALSVNLSPAVVSSLKPAMAKATADGKTLKEKIAALQKQVDSLQAGGAAK